MSVGRSLYLVTLLNLAAAVGSAQTYTGCNSQPASGQLQLGFEILDNNTGLVEVDGVDLRGPTATPFSWSWGDGSTVEGWFPQTHTYTSLSANPFIQVVSHEDDGTSDCAQILVMFVFPTGEQLQAPPASHWASFFQNNQAYIGYDFTELLLGGTFPGTQVREFDARPGIGNCGIRNGVTGDTWPIGSNDMFTDTAAIQTNALVSIQHSLSPGTYCYSRSFQQLKILWEPSGQWMPFGQVNTLQITIYKDKVSFSRNRITKTTPWPPN